MGKLHVSRTHGGYYRVYKLGEKYATPISPKEFIRRADAVKWMNDHKHDCEKPAPTQKVNMRNVYPNEYVVKYTDGNGHRKRKTMRALTADEAHNRFRIKNMLAKNVTVTRKWKTR